MKLALFVCFALAVGNASAAFMDLYGFLSAIFNDGSGLISALGTNKAAPPGNVRVWVQGNKGDEGFYPTFDIYNYKQEKIAGSNGWFEGHGRKIGYGKFEKIDVGVNQEPYYIRFFGNAMGQLALSNIVITYNSGGGSNDDAFSAIITGDNLNRCTGFPAASDDTIIGSGKAQYKNTGGAWIINKFKGADRNYVVSVTVNLAAFKNQVINYWDTCDIIKFRTLNDCPHNSHDCFLPKF